MRARATIESQGSMPPLLGLGLDMSCRHKIPRALPLPQPPKKQKTKKKKMKKNFRKRG